MMSPARHLIEPVALKHKDEKSDVFVTSPALQTLQTFCPYVLVY